MKEWYSIIVIGENAHVNEEMQKFVREPNTR